VSGPATVDFRIYPTAAKSSSTVTTTTTTSTTSSAKSTIVKSTYSSTLTDDSNRFFRTGNTNFYYYQAINLVVYTTGTYSFTSNSAMDTYGYLYNNSFDKTKLSLNLVTQDDNSGGSQQFKLTSILQSGVRYILIVTTSSPAVRGKFQVISSGPARIFGDDD
ncbi:unnamed protein product, partial [Rotaria magnacalcarata]